MLLLFVKDICICFFLVLKADLWKIKTCLAAIIYLAVTVKKNKAAMEKERLLFTASE